MRINDSLSDADLFSQKKSKGTAERHSCCALFLSFSLLTKIRKKPDALTDA